MNTDPKNSNSLYPSNQDFDTEDDRSWQVSYLDVFTILIAFLFIFLSLSDFNEIEVSSISDLFDSSAEQTEFITTPVEEIKTQLQFLLAQEIQNNKVKIERELNDIRIRFSSDELYQSGSATLEQSARALLKNVLIAIKAIHENNDFKIDVEGHTDNTPITTKRYPSNWELSTARASNVVKYFSDMGIDDKNLKASGYADSRPRVPNQDSLGNPIPKNKDLNRRIVIRLYYSIVDE